VQTFVSKIADTWSEAELTGKSGDTATVCLLADYVGGTFCGTLRTFVGI